MRCKNCGGQLRYQDGFYLCENCNSRYDLTSVYEDIDVFIAYIENDEQGRRTRDSIIAQDLFHKLENAKISAFYQRVSAENVTGNDFETVCKTCAAQAKILLLVGTNKDNFEKLIADYRDLLSDKKIIPVYADMNADDLPPELNKLQSLNYNTVGSAADMVKRILQLLGREEEIVFTEAVQNHKNKKKKILCLSLISVLIIIIGISAYVVFGTTLVLPGKKYEAAQTFIQDEKYVDAINVLSGIADYKDSSDLLKGIYDRYEGYYQSDDNTIGLHFIVSDNSVISVEINEKGTDNSIIKITEDAEINKNIATVAFNDSTDQQGTAMIELTNDGINLNIQREQAASKNVFFPLDEKSDVPILEEITAETIKNWLTNGITESELIAKGYELEFERPTYRALEESVYQIKNTDIKVVLVDKGREGTPKLEGISAPAEILVPQKIGEPLAPFMENDILYVPGGEFTDNLTLWIPETESPIISNNTMVGCISKSLMDKEIWEYAVKQAYINYNNYLMWISQLPDSTPAPTETPTLNSSNSNTNSVENNTSTSSVKTDNKKNIEIVMEDNSVMEFELYPDIAPITVDNFLQLVESGFYDGLTFHRIVKNFVIQGGDPTGTGKGGSSDIIKGEFSENGVDNQLKHIKGTISMARNANYDSATSQFFICVKDSSHLDGEYAAFGQMITGFDVLDKLANTEVGEDKQTPIVKPVIKTIRVK